MLSTLADIFGILGFVLTFTLLVRSEKLRNEIVFQKINYRNQQPLIVKKLSHFSNLLVEKESLSLKAASDLRKELYECSLTFGHIFSFRDRKKINNTIKLLNSEYSEKTRKKLINNLNYLTARFSKQEV